MAGSMSRNKGAQYERDLYNFFLAEGFDPIKRNRGGFDGDDLRLGIPEGIFSIEAKNQKALKLASWMDQAIEQADEGMVPIVIHKRKGKVNIGEHFVTGERHTFMKLVWNTEASIFLYEPLPSKGKDLAGWIDDASTIARPDEFPLILHARVGQPENRAYTTTTVNQFMKIARMLN